MGKEKSRKVKRLIRFLLAISACIIIVSKYLEDRNM